MLVSAAPRLREASSSRGWTYGSQCSAAGLVIEDDPDTAEQLVDCLRASGYTVDLGRDGQQGLALGRGADYVVMTADRMLPRLNGIEVIRRLRDDGIVTPTLRARAQPTLAPSSGGRPVRGPEQQDIICQTRTRNADATAVVRESRKSVAAVAQKLDPTETVLRSWGGP